APSARTVERMGQPKDRRQMQHDLSLLECEILQSGMSGLRQCTTVKASHRCGQSQIGSGPTQRRREAGDHTTGGLVMPFLLFRSSDIMQKGCRQQNRAQVLV